MAASFSGPNGVAMDSSGGTIIADTGNSTIRKIVTTGSVNTVSTLAGTASVTGSQDGSGAVASFNNPYGIANDSAGSIYVADTNNNTIRRISPQGLVSTLAGTAGINGSDNGTGVAASFSYPYNIAVDSAGTIYVADNGNNIIRKITAAGVVTTLAGTAGVTGSADGTGSGASFNGPTGIAVDSAGNVYVADTQNSTIRKISPAGVVTTPAWATTANFVFPYGIAIDSTGTIYVSDNGNNVIRKITSSGVVTTLAGTAGVIGSADGTGSGASFNSPSGIAINSAGDVYVADTGNNTVRKITAAGVVSTVVGVVGQRGYKSGALPGLLASPTALAISGTSLYIIVNSGVVVVQNVP
jgi:DNA-binding beta-propeller fold protein YncE